MDCEMIKKLLIKYKAIIIYGIVGCLSTAINIGVYLLCYEIISIPNVPSNIIAWIISVLFAFILNKLYVFESKDMTLPVFMRELVKFILARLGTGLLDVLIMYITVDVMEWNAAVWKIISNIIVIIGNYVLSKFVVFSKNNVSDIADKDRG
ncbi:MAG: GtrA family protein [Proteobacteria bacterium]|nr:GtrA family protein [Pseudomonadota bacterium]